ncbi:flagellar biosynthetic protein FliO [Solimonas fluminis]|uniref:Flagellar protein n=1 Tax=Solimonas fluminis TaxID=2086571 RepID=A0A2S5TGM0_9GAMM|nr:flagellar biosynthetic protein FliO [Solimonas fluminis]PPE74087.1 flagellar biosynthetic protein FliO [Solimonas fluminis]
MSEAAAPAQTAVTVEGVPAPAAPLTGKPMVHAAPSYSSTGGSLASMAGSLVVVLALIFAFAWLMRRVQGLRPARGDALRIEGGLQLGAKERLVIVQAGEARLLLGVTAGGISLLHRLGDAAAEPQAPEADTAALPSFQQAFGEQLHKLLGRK